MTNQSNWSDEPFLLVYDSRSGSTFLANLLVKYLGAAIPPETNFISGIFRKYVRSTIDNEKDLQAILDVVYADNKFSDWQIQRQELDQYIEKKYPISLKNFILQICSLYRTKNYPNSQILGLKKGAYLLNYQRMKETFPKAKFIEIIRDGRAVFNSKKHSIYSVTGKPFETDPYKSAQEWCRMTSLFREVSQKYPTETISIRYEQMIQNPEDTVERLGQFLKVKQLDESDLKTYAVPERYGKLHQNINKKPLQERIDAWQKTLTSKEIYIFEAAAYQHLLQANYKLVNYKLIMTRKFLRKIKQLLKNVSKFKIT
jgi:hypothetical protein